MIAGLRKQWKAVTEAPPGARFRHRYAWRRRQRASPLWKPLFIVAGSGIFVVGLILIFIPGPGFLVIFLGAAMVAQESLWVAGVLDAAEVRLRARALSAQRWWMHASRVSRAAIVLAVMLGAAATAWSAWAAFS